MVDPPRANQPQGLDWREMARRGEQISNGAGMSLRFLKTAADTGGELLEMEATYEKSRARPPEHFHPRQVEHFEILEGTMHARIGGEDRELRTGDTVEIEAGVPHSMWNEGPGTARTLWQTRPALRTEDFFESLFRLARDGAAEGGKPGALRTAVFASEFRDEFRTTSPGPMAQVLAIGVLAPIGRLLGRKP
jgi:quercetin dioxygenase-like cupin family protein